MLTIPFVVLMPDALHAEFLYWLEHQGCDSDAETNGLVSTFINDVETGAYEVADQVKADAHRFYLEVKGNDPRVVAPGGQTRPASTN